MSSVLDQMTAGITKQAKAKLTPVEGEAAKPVGVPDVPGVFLTNEALQDIAKDLRRQAQILIDVADGLDATTGVPQAAKVFAAKQAATDQALKEREADRKIASGEVESFKADFDAKAAAAQAATFAAADAGADEDEPEAPAADGWECPTHGSENLKQLTARSGRKYKACTKCDAFERPTK